MKKDTGKTKQTPEPLTYEHIDRLAKGIAQDLTSGAGDIRTAHMLVALMWNISEYGENEETTANLLLNHIFMWSSKGDEAVEQFAKDVTRQLVSKTKGGTQ